LEKLRLGTFASQRMFFNPNTFEFTDPEKGLFKLDDYAGKSKNLGDKITLPKISQGFRSNSWRYSIKNDYWYY
jgi:hypothetical protein